jgi:hypothetical protein
VKKTMSRRARGAAARASPLRNWSRGVASREAPNPAVNFLRPIRIMLVSSVPVVRLGGLRSWAGLVAITGCYGKVRPRVLFLPAVSIKTYARSNEHISNTCWFSGRRV